MKKSLVALAALALVGAASAQSSVTLYGKANVAIVKVTGADAALTDAGDGSGSRWGLMGTEDLGGGLKANFKLENGYLIDTGSLDNTTNLLFQRQSWMSLSGGFGEVRLGRDYTLGFYGSIGNMPATGVDAHVAVFGFNGMASRNSNQIVYRSPKFSGFQGAVSTQLTGDNVNAVTELALAYANGPLTVNLTGAQANDISGDTWALNAAYKFGVTTVSAGYVDKGIELPGAVVGKGGWLAVKADIGAWTPFAGYANNIDATGTQIESAYHLGVYYALSKRTSLYAMGGQTSNAASTDVTKTMLGVVHNF